MKHYRDNAGTVWAFELDGSQDYLVTEDMRVMTSDEVKVHQNPAPSMEELSALEESWRMTEMTIARENRVAIAEMGDPSVIGTAKQWQDYWLALRDWKDGNPDFPDTSKRPKAPTGE